MAYSLSARTGRTFRRVAAEVDVRGPDQRLKRRQVTVLIHGYNNSQPDAEASYRRFRKKLARQVTPGRLRRIGPIWEFHWPGDLPSPLWSKASFPARIADAEASGELLGNFLAIRCRPETRVNLIAHSLGCHVALQAVESVSAANAPERIRRVVLMAAAVPTLMCAGAEEEFGPHEGTAETVLYSRSDRVLELAYPLGAAGYWGIRAEAVGRRGNPADRWTTVVHTGLHHGEYWDTTTAVVPVAKALGIAKQRTLPGTAPPAAGLPRRELRGRPRRARRTVVGA